MKILFQSRTNIFSAAGGDTIQLLKTKEYLEHLGCKVDISLELNPDVSCYDIVHLFNLMAPQEILSQLNNAKKQGKKIALSTIYGLYTEFERRARGGIGQLVANILNPYQFEYLKTIARYVKTNNFHYGVHKLFWDGYYKSMKNVVDNTDVFLPNSHSEMKRVANEFGLRDYKYVAVPNAIDTKVFNYDLVKVDNDLKKYQDCILCAARIEGRKSQLNLIRAVKDTEYQLVLVGKPSQHQDRYLKQIENEIGPNVHMIGALPHYRLAMLYKISRVHALISWMETPGLSSLEAVAMKSNIVVTRKGDTMDYFGNDAFYCSPDDVPSIRKAIDLAYAANFNTEFRNRILENYCWEKTAEATLSAYKKVLN
jgi:glycosyltransferase involved in cell wall biosynthesis